MSVLYLPAHCKREFLIGFAELRCACSLGPAMSCSIHQGHAPAPLSPLHGQHRPLPSPVLPLTLPGPHLHRIDPHHRTCPPTHPTPPHHPAGHPVGRALHWNGPRGAAGAVGGHSPGDGQRTHGAADQPQVRPLLPLPLLGPAAKECFSPVLLSTLLLSAPAALLLAGWGRGMESSSLYM